MVRRKTCQAIIVLWLTLTLVSTLYYSYHVRYLDIGPISSYTCTGDSPRSRQCIVKNFCVDRSGGFVVADSYQQRKQMKQDLNVNVINADENADIYYQPKVKWRHANAGVPIRNDTLFVYGLYAPEHFSHMLFNGLMALYRTIKLHNGTRDSWMYRALVTESYPYMGQPLFTTDFFNDGRDIVTDTHSLTSGQQLLLQHDETVCFEKAVIGAGNACSLSYCEQPIESDIYASFRDEAVDYYVTRQQWRQHNENSFLHDTNRDDQACVETMKVSLPTPTATVNNTKVIAIINRSKSRKITNEQELIDALKSKYIIKQISFDHGCSLASSAYVMHDVDMLISPHGSQEGAAIFMKDNSLIISIDGRGYSEWWFAYPFTGMGRRFYNFECQDMECVETDALIAKQVFERFGVRLPSQEAVQECAAWTNDRRPDECIQGYLDKIDPQQARDASAEYLKSAPRKADLKRLIPFITKSMQEMDDFKHFTYRDICDLEKCCGPDCSYPLQLNVYGSARQGKLKAWPLDPITDEAKNSWVD